MDYRHEWKIALDPGDLFVLRQRLRAKTIVDYTREPFVYGPGNVRVTLDENIRTGLSCVDFLDPDCVTVPAPDARPLMEVKWDAFFRTSSGTPCSCRGGRWARF